MSTFSRLSPSGIKVIIVGAGFAGLTAAIECDRKGHTVILLDKFSELQPLEDVISFGANSGRIFRRWEGVEDKLDSIGHRSPGIDFRDWHGKLITRQSWKKEANYGKKYNGPRGNVHEIMFLHAKDRGIDIRLGQNITEYFEEMNGAGVVSNGDRVVADVVLISEGVKSHGRKAIFGCDYNPRPSGYAIYRAWFPSDDLARNPKTAHLVVNGDTHCAWIGPDVHFLTASLNGGSDFSWVMTHKDEADIEESWEFPGRVGDVLKCLEGWDSTTHEIIKATPSDRLIDYKLVFRDPLPTFISPKARIALIGDAAHPFLPTSIQAASQAMEDGVVMAVCLEKSGKAQVSQALKVYETLRYERVCKAQEAGITSRGQWHRADWDKIREHPESLYLRREPWLLDFDAESDAYRRYDGIARVAGTSPVQVTNTTLKTAVGTT